MAVNPTETIPGSVTGIHASYIGEPQYPDTWVTKQPRESLRDNGKARIICLAPDVCLTGPHKVPVPYMISDRCDHPDNYSKTVFHAGRRVLLLRSNTQHVEGDDPGDGGGIKSGTFNGICEPIDHAPQYRVEGSPVVCHLHRFKMNNNNTIGEAYHICDTKTYSKPNNDDPLPGSMYSKQIRSEMASDAGSESSMPMVLGAQYAANVAAQPAPENPLPSEPLPRSLPPADPVIRPGPDRAPQWYRAPAATSAASEAETWGTRLFRWGRLGSGIGTFLTVFFYMEDKPYFYDTIPPFGEEGRKIQQDAMKIWKEKGVSKAENYYNEQMRALQAKQESQRQSTTTPSQVAQSAPEQNARISDELERCGIRPHKDNKNKCPKGSQSHHGMIHFPFRTGSQTDPGLTAPDSPAYEDAYTICVPNDEHTQLHRVLNAAINGIGKSGDGTISFDDLFKLVEDSIDELPDKTLSSDCKEIYKNLLKRENPFGDKSKLRGLTVPTKDLLEILRRLWARE